MKCLAFTVTAVGDASELTVIGLVKLDFQQLETLTKLRSIVADLANQTRGLQKSFAYLALDTSTIHWLLVGYSDDADEATEKIYTKLCDSEYGVVEIPEDVYESRVHKHTELFQRAEGGGMLRTEYDLIRLRESGVYYTCEEKYCCAIHETNLVPWHMIFDEK